MSQKKSNRRTRAAVGVLGVIIVLAVTAQAPQPYPPSITARCTRVIDGDTIRCDIDGESESIRLIGINTPERGEAKWKEARDFVKELCLDKDVRLEFDVESRDRYGRMLGYVFSRDADGNEVFVNKELLSAGHAKYFGFFNMGRYDEALKLCFCDTLDEKESSGS